MSYEIRPAVVADWEALKDLGSYDLIVAGGGAAGSACAITAGRLGLSCLLIDPLSFLGGTGVGSQVTPWMGNHIDMGPLNEGLTGELQRDMEATGDAYGYYVNPEALKGWLERKAVDAGATLLFESQIVAVQLSEGRRATGLVIATRHGLARASARTIVDASGDAHVARLAGVPCREGRETDRVHQPMSLRFVLGNIDHEAIKTELKRINGLTDDGPGAFTNGHVLQHFLSFAQKEGWPEKWLKIFTIQFFAIPGRPRELWFNCPRITGFDPLDPLSVSQAYVEGRRMIDAYLKMFRNQVPGGRDAYLVAVAPMIGIREGRRIVGRYTLTADDFYKQRKFEDGICLNRYPIDIHNPHGQGVTLIDMEPGSWHEIPYRCLVPEGIASLLVAGRCVSSDFTAQASYRIIPNCRTMGEAAGVAAWLSHQEGRDVSELDGRIVRGEMLDRGLLPAWLSHATPRGAATSMAVSSR